MAVRAVSLVLLLGLTACVQETASDDTGVGCGDCGPRIDGPSTIPVPPAGAFDAARTGADELDADATSGASMNVDVHACAHQRFSKALPLGSIYLLVHAVDDNLCELWLGGETEDPSYDGHPTEYCQLYRENSFLVTLPSGGGPLHIDLPWCINL